MIKTQKNAVTITSRTTIVIALLAFLLLGCATTGPTKQDLNSQYQPIAKLSDGLEDSGGQDSALLAPGLFEQTDGRMNQASELAREANSQTAQLRCWLFFFSGAL